MGRPLDIWSVGCVVVEMATGKLPWPEYDNQYQIMFQIGMGKSPSVAMTALPDEGHNFLSHCFQGRPEDRWKAGQLLTHPFVKVSGRSLWVWPLLQNVSFNFRFLMTLDFIKPITTTLIFLLISIVHIFLFISVRHIN